MGAESGFNRGLDATRASMYVVTSGLTADMKQPRLGAWFHAGAALEGVKTTMTDRYEKTAMRDLFKTLRNSKEASATERPVV